MSPGKIRALPYLNLAGAEYQKANRKYLAEVAALEEKVAIAMKNEEFYRRQLLLEAKLGMALHLIAG